MLKLVYRATDACVAAPLAMIAGSTFALRDIIPLALRHMTSIHCGDRAVFIGWFSAHRVVIIPGSSAPAEQRPLPQTAHYQ